jgi:hypothetical protein
VSFAQQLGYRPDAFLMAVEHRTVKRTHIRRP